MRAKRHLARELISESGILGTYGETLALSDVEILGRAFGTFIRRRGGSSVAVCFDCRRSSPDLAAAVIAGLGRTGTRVFRLGCGPLPLLFFGARYLGADAAVMVTGLDAEPSMNGLQLFFGGCPLGADAVAANARLAENGDFLSGSGSQRETPVLTEYLAMLTADTLAEAHELAVVWNAGNGASGRVLAMLTRRMSGRHVLVNGTMDSEFPARRPWRPLEETLDGLLKIVVAERCDFGFVFDAAGARMIGIDAQGIRLVQDGKVGSAIDEEDPGGRGTFRADPILLALQAIHFSGGARARAARVSLPRNVPGSSVV